MVDADVGQRELAARLVPRDSYRYGWISLPVGLRKLAPRLGPWPCQSCPIARGFRQGTRSAAWIREEGSNTKRWRSILGSSLIERRMINLGCETSHRSLILAPLVASGGNSMLTGVVRAKSADDDDRRLPSSAYSR